MKMDDEKDYSWIASVFEDYGWYILIGVIALLVFYEKYIKSFIIHLKSRYDESVYVAKYHKDPDMVASILMAQQKRAQLLQEKYNKDAERAKEKQEEKERRRREELAQKTDGGQRLGSSSTNSSLRPEYNPLMGPGSSSGYRPPKRSACGKGGCG